MATKTTVAPVTIEFELEKETKNTFRFAELDLDGARAEWGAVKVGSIYVNKSVFEGKPSGVRVTVEPIY